MARLLRRILVVLFGLLYNELAWTYDLVAWGVSMGQWRSWQRSALPFVRGRRVLEVAHGTGNILLDLAAGGFEPVGFDLSPHMGRIAARKLRRALGPAARRVPLVRGRAQALPFAAGSFGSLLATFPTEFIVEPAAIAEFQRVLAPGGVVVLVPSVLITGGALGDRLAGALFRVTGQSASGWYAPVVERYAALGFAARVEQVRLPRSVVTVIVAQRLADTQ